MLRLTLVPVANAPSFRRGYTCTCRQAKQLFAPPLSARQHGSGDSGRRKAEDMSRDKVRAEENRDQDQDQDQDQDRD